MNYEEFKKKFQKVPVEHYSTQVPDNPLVSVCVQTYQHVDYIQDCLDGILMQQTGFPVEVLLGDDASTDGTREICIEYAEKYPNNIRLFLHRRENNIQIAGRPTGRFNFMYNLYNTKGDYVALCEGDDYWTDPNKLQKQVEFLETNPIYYLCFHDIDSKDGTVLKENNISLPTDDISKIETLLTNRNYIHTPSVVLKNDFEIPEWFSESPIGDYLLYIVASKGRRIKYLDEKMAVYRYGVGIQSSLSKSKKIKNWVDCLSILHNNLEGEYNQLIKKNIFREICLITSEKILCETEWYKELISSVLNTSDDVLLFLNSWDQYKRKQKGKLWKLIRKIIKT